ncbi:MAG TPA: FtsX-like permease family protein [Puia sp.]|nr:FtsX-like permease family protein [Puia sp.]
MIKNYLLVALRNLRHKKIFSAINVLGLAIGISASLVIFLIVQYHYSFDKFEKDRDRIYRVVSDYKGQDNEGHTRGVQGPLAEAVKKEISGPELTVAFRYYNALKLAVPGKEENKPTLFKPKDNIIFAAPDYFQLFSYHWIAGSAATALASSGQVVLSESRAKLYFPSVPVDQVIGKKMIYDDTVIAVVAGVVQDFDKQGNTDFQFKEFISLATLLNNHGMRKNFYWDDWGSTASDQQLYVKLGKNISVASVEAKLKILVEKYKGDDEKKNNYSWVFHLQPLKDIHFNDHYGTFRTETASMPMLYGLMLIAGFLLLLACINFINLMTAQATSRAKEIGIRKTLGGSKWQLFSQFISETFVVTLIATILSVALTPLLLKAFADFIPEGLHFTFNQPSLFIFLFVMLLIVTFFAGAYPSLVLSSSKTLDILKNQTSRGGGRTRKALMRQTLTVSQFVIAQFFIMGTLLVSKQISFMMNQNPGFSKEAIFSFGTSNMDTSYTHRRYFVNELQNIPGVAKTSLANDNIFSWGWWQSGIDYKQGKKDISTTVEIKAGDSNYLALYHIPILAGRDLLPADTIKEVVINETYLHVLGFKSPSDAIGKILSWENKNVPIVGVMKDFHAHALDFKINPMVFCHDMHGCRTMIIALQPGEKKTWSPAIAKIEKAFKQAYPEEEFSYNFLDETLAKAYNNEQNISRLLQWATGLTILISCLGLLGLVIYITTNRTKEIGVRKVLGASVTQIVTILSKDFLILVGIAFLIATPFAIWSINKWLDGFAFKTQVSWWVFGISGLGMILIALAVLSVQTIKAAMANPVKSLRTE